MFAIHLGWVARLPQRLVIVTGPAGSPLPVVLFFVLSGFLITTLMLREEERFGRIDLSAFYARRARRIMPCMVVFLTVLGALAASGRITMVWRHYVLAWLYLGNAVDFTHYERTLAHTWSLAVEEHFYLVFPVLMATLPRRWRVPVIAALAAACTPLRVALAHSSLVGRYPVSRFSLPAADAILVGALGAYAWRTHRARAVSVLTRWWMPLLVAGLIAVPALLPARFDAWTYVPWVVGLALLLGLVVARPASRVVRALEWAPLRALGLISYGLYVWQGLFLRNGPAAPELLVQHPGLSVLATFAAATASYVLVERRVLARKPTGVRRRP